MLKVPQSLENMSGLTEAAVYSCVIFLWWGSAVWLQALNQGRVLARQISWQTHLCKEVKFTGKRMVEVITATGKK